MDKDEFPLLRSGDVEDAFPDINVGPVVKAFPDIRVGDVLKLDSGALNADFPPAEDRLGLVVIEPEAGDGLRVGSTFVGSNHIEDLTEMLHGLDHVAGTLDVSVLEVDGSLLVCKVVEARPGRGESET